MKQTTPAYNKATVCTHKIQALGNSTRSKKPEGTSLHTIVVSVRTLNCCWSIDCCISQWLRDRWTNWWFHH